MWSVYLLQNVILEDVLKAFPVTLDEKAPKKRTLEGRFGAITKATTVSLRGKWHYHQRLLRAEFVMGRFAQHLKRPSTSQVN